MKSLTPKQEILLAVGWLLTGLINSGIPCILLGGGIIYLSFMGLRFLKRIGEKGLECTGTILFYETSPKGHQTPVVEFTTANLEVVKRKPYVYASTDLSKIRTYKKLIGTQVPILYMVDTPEQFVIKTEEKFSVTILGLAILVGSFFVGYGIYLLFE